MRKRGVDITEFNDNDTYYVQIKKLRKETIIAVIQWGFSMFVTTEYVFLTLWGERINIGVSCYIIAKLKLKKVSND